MGLEILENISTTKKGLLIISMRKQKIYELLKGIETGEPSSVEVVNEDKYIQHNPQTEEGGEGLAQLFSRLSKTNPKVEIVRLFEDGDFVFGQTIYDFSSMRIGFEVFRYEGDQVVEHWDNIQARVGDLVAGTVEATDLELTERNRDYIHNFIKDVAIEKKTDEFEKYVDFKQYTEHSTFMNLRDKVSKMDYKTNHRLLAEGSFILSVNEGFNKGVNTSFYDLFRVSNGKIVEHWDTTEKVPEKSQWKNNNGKFLPKLDYWSVIL
jgi:predicted SnoaL-like aldol condensation-catalyzing enzyme